MSALTTIHWIQRALALCNSYSTEIMPNHLTLPIYHQFDIVTELPYSPLSTTHTSSGSQHYLLTSFYNNMLVALFKSHHLKNMLIFVELCQIL